MRSDGLIAAFRRTGCGCDRLQDAETETDDSAIAVAKSDGAIQQAKWHCPSVTKSAPDETLLDDEHREVLERVEKLTGAKCATCPNWYARQNATHEVAAARRWRDAGQLRERVGFPSTVLVAAIDVMDAAHNARERDDYEREKRERERRDAERNAGRDE